MNDTEKRNQNTLHIDKMSVSQMLETLQTENYNALKAVDRALKSVEKAIVAIEPKMKQGGRLFYVGCGTSGRLGVMDAAECPPTFGIAPDRVTGIIAGGDEALKRAVENYEDDAEKGKEALLGHELSALDCVMGISAAGGAKFVIGALQYAREKGCTTIALTNNIDTPIEKKRPIFHCRNNRTRTDYGFDAHESRNNAKADTKYDFDNIDDPHGICVRKSDDKFAPRQHKAQKKSREHCQRINRVQR